MGYYIDFVFDEDQISNYGEVVELFCKVGARVDDNQCEKLPGNLIIKKEDYIDLKHPGIANIISVNKKEANHLKGNWAYVRFRWDEPVESFAGTVKKILDLADSIGCRIYDGQLQNYVTVFNLKRIEEIFIQGSKSYEEIFGMRNSSPKFQHNNLIIKLDANDMREVCLFPLFGKEFYDIKSFNKIIRKYNIDSIRLASFDLSVRTSNCLKKANIQFLHEVLKMSPSQILQIKNVSRNSVEELQNIAQIIIGLKDNPV